jgi:hypothetical protein
VTFNLCDNSLTRLGQLACLVAKKFRFPDGTLNPHPL